MKKFLLLFALVSLVSTGAFAALVSADNTANVQRADVDELNKTSVSPGFASSVDVLETVRFTMNAPLVSVNSTAKVEVRSMLQGVVADATMSIDEEDPTVLVVTLSKPVVDKGSYRITVEAGSVSSADADNVEFFTMVMVTGKAAPHDSFEVKAITPAPNAEDPSAIITSLLSFKLSFSDWVGGLDPNKRPTFGLLADPESMREVSIELDSEDWGAVNIKLPVEIKEPGTYLLHIPEATIYDNQFDEDEPDFGVGYWSATYNPAYDFVYRVGEGLTLSAVSPENGSTVKSLKDITLFMNTPVGGFAEGAVFDVMRNGDKVDEATLDWGMEIGGNELMLSLSSEQTEYGHYSIVIPAGVIFDKSYDPVDPFFSGATANDEFVLEYNVGEFGVAAVSPENLSTLKTLKEVTLFMSAPVGGFAEGAVIDVLRNGDKIDEATLDWGMEPGSNEVAVVVNHELSEHGRYTIVVPAGVIFDKSYDPVDPFFSGAASNEEFILEYNVGEFGVSAVSPENLSTVKSLKEITLFMNARVGGFDDGAKIDVLRNGDKVDEATLDWGMEPYSNEVTLNLSSEQTEYGHYTIVVPAGVIFDELYNEVDPFFSGAVANEEFMLEYNVGEFGVAAVSPENLSTVKSLKEVTIFMSAPVGGFAEGAVIDVLRNGDKVDEAKLDWGMEPDGNELSLSLTSEQTEYGHYTIVVPAGVIFDKSYDPVDPFFSGAAANEEFILEYNVGEFGVAAVSPENLSTVKSLKEVSLFMSARVGGFDDGAVIDVLRNGDKVGEATLDWGMEPGSNEVAIILGDEQTEYGHYAIVVPAGVIFDEGFDPVDPFFSGAASNEEFILEYNVGEFSVSEISPKNGSVVQSLKDITIFMSARVGGFDDGAALDVLRDGEKVCDATLDWGMEPYTNEVAVTLSAAQDAPGVYTIEIPAGVIFDERFDAADPFFSGAACNEAFTLTYTILEPVDVPYTITPADGSVVSSIYDFIISFEGIERATGKSNPGIILYNASGEEVTSTGKYAIFNGATDTELTFELLDEVTEKGDYRLVIPAGVFSYYKAEFDQEKADKGVDYPYTDVLVGKNDEIVLNLTIGEPDGITRIGADAEASGKVYNLGGVRVSGKLPKGVYIVNGKKVYVK